ncbi:CPBP family intramembrane glutamic endopeptidase [Bacteroides sp.]|uniref:CPBP family intramembrane glutamic endopeptidase n=1 Tax=Bacteroides sp. TaxID=29523 RepID=UPI002602A4D0|nr:CPBP family intramembrane glutamic endopeptidase [Bacteroides sp.]MDD3037962.1 CPBP family intramembrane metalloprotease [Bacteroides sp.]
MKVEELIEKKESQRIPAWVCILLMVVGLFIFFGLYSTIVKWGLAMTVGEGVMKTEMWKYIIMESCMLLAVLSSVIILLYFERRPFSDLGLSLKGHMEGIWYGALLAVVLYMIGFGLSFAFGLVEVTGFQFDLLTLVWTFCFFLLVALTEEIMMRGYILGRLMYTKLNKFLSLLISSLVFAFMHLFNPNIAFLPMLNLVLAGMLLGATFLYTRNLCFPLSLHLFWNWIQGPVLGYEVSGNNFGTSMLTLHLPEENVLNGGAFGFEGSLICTVLMIVFTILIIWWGEKREAISLAVSRSC